MDKERIVEAARRGAEKYADVCFDYLRQFAAIDCGTGDIEGNRKVVRMVDEMLSKIDGIKIEHFFYEGYGTNIAAKLTPPDPKGKIILNAHMDTVFKKGMTAEHPFRVEGDIAWGLVGAILSVLEKPVVRFVLADNPRL